ncbi:MAG: peptidoglycan-binding protein [Mycobacteriales bacterium]
MTERPAMPISALLESLQGGEQIRPAATKRIHLLIDKHVPGTLDVHFQLGADLAGFCDPRAGTVPLVGDQTSIDIGITVEASRPAAGRRRLTATISRVDNGEILTTVKEDYEIRSHPQLAAQHQDTRFNNDGSATIVVALRATGNTSVHARFSLPRNAPLAQADGWPDSTLVERGEHIQQGLPVQIQPPPRLIARPIRSEIEVWGTVAPSPLLAPIEIRQDPALPPRSLALFAAIAVAIIALIAVIMVYPSGSASTGARQHPPTAGVAPTRQPRQQPEKEPPFPGQKSWGTTVPVPDVYLLQCQLRGYGYDLRTDGRFGDETRRTVAAFQREHLSTTYVASSVDSNTWRKLFAIPRPPNCDLED